MSYRIYTAGKMAGLSKRDQIGWRYKIEQCVRDAADMFGIPQSSLKFIHPPVYYTYGEKHYQSEKEIKDWDINQVCKSDIVIVNLDSVDDSIGTHYELATVDAVNSFNSKHIFVIGIGGKDKILHPWIEDTLHRREEDYENAANYIVHYLLV